MLVKSFDRKDLLFILVCVSVSLVLYTSLFWGFFQQDEWLGYARHILLKGSTPSELIKYSLTPGLGHYTPLTPLLVYLSFSLFGLNYNAHVLISLILHAFVIALFYNFSKFFFPKKIAFFSTLLFGLTAASFQGTAWVVANLGTHMSSIFGLMSLIFTTKFLAGKKKRFLALGVAALLTSLLFKELTLGLFIILPLLILFWGKAFTKKQKITSTVLILFVGLIYITFRIFLIHGLSDKLNSEYAAKSNSFVYNLATVPIKSLSQVIIPVNILKEFSFKITSLIESELVGDYGSPEFESFAVKRTLEVISLSLSLIFVIFVVIIKSKPDQKITVFFTLFIFLNSIIFALAPEKEGVISAIDSRNLYFISIGSSLLITSFLMNLFKKYFVHAFVLVLFFNAYFLNQYLLEFNNRGKIRREILQEIKAEYPKLPPKVIFYTESDTSFYGLPKSERILPFQSGFGQTLLAWYYPAQKFPKEFFMDKFLWEIKAQGYRQIDNRGFGYFRDFNLLANEIDKSKIPLESVISFRYDSQDNQVTNNSQELMNRLKGFFAKKVKISQDNFLAASLNNPTEINLVQDGDRKTFWNSITPYKNEAIVDIELSVPVRVSQIEIDSYTNRDQNEVGYEVFLSSDKENWESVFYSKRYIPDSDGFANIYFEPQKARFIRIQQIGFHEFAPWVIHELNIYASQ